MNEIKLKGLGAPSNKTEGGIGDIYMDTTTGTLYKCVYAYRSSVNNEFKYTWKKTLQKVKITKSAKPVNIRKEDTKNKPETETKEEPTQQTQATSTKNNSQVDYTAFNKQRKQQ